MSTPSPSPASEPGGPFAALGRIVRGVRRRVLVHRRSLAALLVGVAALLVLRGLQTPPPPSVEVWTAAHDLAGGQPLARADLRRTPFAPGTAPDGAVRDPRRLVGRTVAAPLRRGQPVTDLTVVAGPLAIHDPDRTVVPVRLTDTGIADLLHVGDRVDLIAVDPDRSHEPSLVAAAARVVAVPDEGGVHPGATGAQPGRLVVFSVLPSEADEVAAGGASGFLTLTLSG